MVFFGDFGKTVTDLFKTSKYELDRTLKVTCKSDNTEWSTEASFPAKNGGQSSTTATYKHSDKKLGTLEIEVPSGKTLTLDYQTPKLMDGLKSNFVVEYPKLTYKGKYSHSAFKGKAKIACDAKDTSNISATVEGSTCVQGLHVGGEVKYSTKKGLNGYAVGGHYTKGDTQLAFKTKKNFDVFNVQLHKKYSATGEVAADYDLDRATYSPTVTVGGKWKLDDKSTVQGCIKSDSSVYVLYKHKLSDLMTASMGTTFDIQNNMDNVNVHYKFEFES